ncbi:MAG: KGG domain-containing protein [Flavisolibacter sp.]
MAEMNNHNGEQRRSVRGFAAMDAEKQREIARKGGRAAHEQGVAHEWSSHEAREAGKKGGQSRGRRSKEDGPAM